MGFLNKNEVYEHLGYFHNLSKKLKLPYEPLLAKFKEHRLKLINKNNGAQPWEHFVFLSLQLY